MQFLVASVLRLFFLQLQLLLSFKGLQVVSVDFPPWRIWWYRVSVEKVGGFWFCFWLFDYTP